MTCDLYYLSGMSTLSSCSLVVTTSSTSRSGLSGLSCSPNDLVRVLPGPRCRNFLMFSIVLSILRSCEFSRLTTAGRLRGLRVKALRRSALWEKTSEVTVTYNAVISIHAPGQVRKTSLFTSWVYAACDNIMDLLV